MITNRPVVVPVSATL